MDFDIIEISDFTGDMAHIYSVMPHGQELYYWDNEDSE